LIVLTSFFGQNFGWLVDHIGDLASFLIFGVVLPIVGAALLVVYLRRQQLL
jgi:magnesium transporter